MSKRDPFPSPKLENDFTLSGFRPQPRKNHLKPHHVTQKEEPWSRLYDTATFASTQRRAVYQDHQVPNDSLEFQLKSIYDHHKDVFCNKNQMVLQMETACEHERRRKPLEKEQGDDIRVWVDPKRNSIYSIK